MVAFSMLNSRARIVISATIVVMNIRRKRQIYKKKQLRRFWRRGVFKQRELHSEYFHLYQTMRDIDREYHYQYIRMSKERFDHLLSLIREDITKKRHPNAKSNIRRGTTSDNATVFGLVFLLMCDNLRANQACFRMYNENFGEGDIFSCTHLVFNEVFKELYLLYDPTHLLKNIRNNWHTEKMQKLKFIDPETNQIVIAKWSDLVKIYDSEKDSMLKNTKLTHATLYPTNFEKQKVSLAMNIFNERTVAAMELLEC
jgi:hypothetical protein